MRARRERRGARRRDGLARLREPRRLLSEHDRLRAAARRVVPGAAIPRYELGVNRETSEWKRRLLRKSTKFSEHNTAKFSAAW